MESEADNLQITNKRLLKSDTSYVEDVNNDNNGVYNNNFHHLPASTSGNHVVESRESTRQIDDYS